MRLVDVDMDVYVPVEITVDDTKIWTFMSRLQRRLFVVVGLVLLWFCFKGYYFELMMNTLGPSCKENCGPAQRYLLDRIELDCDALFEGDRDVAKFYQNWIYDQYFHEKKILQSADRCAAIFSRFQFPTTPLSQEEREYPLAYGLVVYKNFIQVLYMLSAFYQPQNLYCIAIDARADKSFLEVMKNVEGCLPNIKIIRADAISWGSYAILAAVHSCLNYTARAEHPWKYYQYLSGTDVPLKTNLEMVRIFRALNNTMNMEMSPFQSSRLRQKNITFSPLPLFKASLSALVPRAAANEIVTNNKTNDLFEFLKGTWIPDESLWATAGGSPNVLPMPGGVPVADFIKVKERVVMEKRKRRDSNITGILYPISSAFDTPNRYYVSRYQVWGRSGCRGKLTSASCVFGVHDLPALKKRYELVAHKLYFDFQPAAYFCMLKEHWRRTLNPEPFDARNYTRLPQVEYHRGVPITNLTHPEFID